jgi:hypothetical protein
VYFDFVFMVNFKCCPNIFEIFLGKIDFVILSRYLKKKRPRGKMLAAVCGHVYLIHVATVGNVDWNPLSQLTATWISWLRGLNPRG